MTITGKKFHFSYRKLYGAAALVLLAGILFLLIFEVMTVNPAIQNMIRDGRTHQIDNVIYGGNDKTILSMDSELQRLTKAGVISREMALLHATNPEVLSKRI